MVVAITGWCAAESTLRSISPRPRALPNLLKGICIPMDFETYSRSGRFEYAELADIVASILGAALKAYPVKFRLQQVQHRAKGIDSLKKKLEDRNILSTTTLGNDIKDLAGCRLIFYTNSDVTRFLRTGIIQDNFDVDRARTKIHYPVPGRSGPDDLFISHNYVVTLKANRASLPEYGRFGGLACEVQVQTTLNHAWSEMEHDILYKAPKLEGFGEKLFEAIKARLRTIMKTHLLPAGYEFQKALDDFERLMSGKEILDRGALKALTECPDNNARVELLERFRDYVVPHYDDPASVYPEIKDQLVAAIHAARLTKARAIETPFGNLPGAIPGRVTEIATDILKQLRYVSIEITFAAVCELFPGAQTDEERKHLLELTEKLTEHNLDVWKQAGPAAQMIVLQQIRNVPKDQRDPLRPVLREALDQMLGTEVGGMSNTYNTMTLHHGPVVSSEALKKLRSDALDILFDLYRTAASDQERQNTQLTIFSATSMPVQANYSDNLLVDVLNDSVRVVDFYREIASGEAHEILQKVENGILWLNRQSIGIRNDPKVEDATLAAVDKLSASIQKFRDVLDANKLFTIYKTLVGYDSVFPMMWENEHSNHTEEDEYRKARIDEFVAGINVSNADEWFAIIRRCSQTESSDAATFPNFGEFLKRLSKAKPAIVLGYTDKLDEKLAGFLGVMLAGLEESNRAEDANAKIAVWLSEDKYLTQIAHYYRFAAKLDNKVLSILLNAGMRLKSDDIVSQVLATVFVRYKDGTRDLLDSIIIPAIRYFSERHDTRWVNLAWYLPRGRTPIIDLTEDQAAVILENLVQADRIETHTDMLLTILAERFPERVFDLFEQRMAYEALQERTSTYQAVPHRFYQLQSQFTNIADHAVELVRQTFVGGDRMFEFTGGRLIAASFPGLPDALQHKLSSYIRPDAREETEFVVRILRAYRGEALPYEFVKEVVKALPPEDKLLGQVQAVLQGTGVVSGEFGLVEAHKQKREALVPWLCDEDERVKAFAVQYIKSLDLQIAAEQRQSEEDLEMRKRMDDNPPDDNDDSKE
jgi:ppGpp synthetase/RelA/SpoT-type nucleotidyltranferase